MNWNDFKVMWVDALRSGNYAQAKRTLRKWTDGDQNNRPAVEGFCCLGVAAELVEPGCTYVEWVKSTYDDQPIWCSEGGGYLRNEDELNPDFIEAYGLQKLMGKASQALKDEAISRGIALTKNTELGYVQVMDVLMCLNDSSQCTFEDMADIIERHL